MPISRARLALSFIAALSLSHAALACVEGQQVLEITPKTGEQEETTVTLTDGSIWTISEAEVKKIAAWKPEQAIIACNDELVNVDLSQSVGASRTQ